MIRRKGIGKDCCGDPCGNKIRKINGISPDPNGDFSIEAGTGITVTGDENGVIIDASRAVGILTVNDEPPDADGNIKISGGSHVDVSENDGEIVIDTTGVVEGSGNIGSDVKPIKIVNGQAVAVTNDLVDVSTDNQVINASKTFKQSINIVADNTDPVIEITSNYPRIIGHNPNNLNNSDGMFFQEIGYDDSQIIRYQMDGYRRGSASQTELHRYVRNNPNQLADNGLFITDNNEAWMTSPSRAYNANNTSDIVTIGSLQQSSDVVHRTGNEIITGTKRLSNASMNDRNVKPTTEQVVDLDIGNNTVGGAGCSFKLRFQQNTDGSRAVYVGIWDNSISNYKFTNIATQTWS